jgi:hypothetical protein
MLALETSSTASQRILFGQIDLFGQRTVFAGIAGKFDILNESRSTGLSSKKVHVATPSTRPHNLPNIL